MAKAVLAFCTCCVGIVLCVWGNAAFAALGVIIGIGAFICGVYLLAGFFAGRVFPLALSLCAMGFGALLVILCVFVEAVAFFLGGLVLAAAGIALIPFCRICLRVILPLCCGCILCGVVIIFAPSFMGWITTAAGILLVAYSHIIAIFVNN